MTSGIYSEIHTALDTVGNLYHKLVLVVGESGTGKTLALREVGKTFKTDVINVSLAISSEFLALTAKQRVLRLPGILDQITDNQISPVVLDNLEFLFDVDLKLDPLRLLQRISRNQSILASWNGTVDDSKLIYAEHGHPEHRKYDASDIQIVTINKPADDGAGKFDGGAE